MNKNEQSILIISYSYHHRNTEKIAKVFAKILNAEIANPNEIDLQEIKNYEILGFGSGIYSQKHHEFLLHLAEKLPENSNKKSFIFSTAALTNKKKMKEDHSALREILQSKGYIVINEFQCKGFNTNSFMKYFGGMNKKRPNANDLNNAEKFALNIKKNLE
jgi:flavodoxin